MMSAYEVAAIQNKGSTYVVMKHFALNDYEQDFIVWASGFGLAGCP